MYNSYMRLCVLTDTQIEETLETSECLPHEVREGT